MRNDQAVLSWMIMSHTKLTRTAVSQPLIWSPVKHQRLWMKSFWIKSLVTQSLKKVEHQTDEQWAAPACADWLLRLSRGCLLLSLGEVSVELFYPADLLRCCFFRILICSSAFSIPTSGRSTLGKDVINSQVAETYAATSFLWRKADFVSCDFVLATDVSNSNTTGVLSQRPSWVTIAIWLFLRATEQRGGSRRRPDGEAVQVERVEEDWRRGGKERDDHPLPPRSADKARWVRDDL